MQCEQKENCPRILIAGDGIEGSWELGDLGEGEKKLGDLGKGGKVEDSAK